VSSGRDDDGHRLFIKLKERQAGCLIYPSDEVVRAVERMEEGFQLMSTGLNFSQKNIGQNLQRQFSQIAQSVLQLHSTDHTAKCADGLALLFVRLRLHH
jgi:hypothetical protein